jgi:hypothetical protein
MKLNSWFEITEKDYIWYKLQGYTIAADEYRVVWLLDSNLHREDGPAFIGADGTQAWYQNGKRHREDGPARIGENGGQEWWLNGKLHRTDGPAYTRADGTQEWYLNDKEYTEQEWKDAVGELV